MSDLRHRIAAAACGATSAGKLFPWDTLSEPQRDSWRAVADAVIRELQIDTEDGECITADSSTEGKRSDQLQLA